MPSVLCAKLLRVLVISAALDGGGALFSAAIASVRVPVSKCNIDSTRCPVCWAPVTTPAADDATPVQCPALLSSAAALYDPAVHSLKASQSPRLA